MCNQPELFQQPVQVPNTMLAYYDNNQQEIQKLHQHVTKFAETMFIRLKFMVMEGRKGWDDPDWHEELVDRIKSKTTPDNLGGNEVDIANYLMMLWYLNNEDRKPQT